MDNGTQALPARADGKPARDRRGATAARRGKRRAATNVGAVLAALFSGSMLLSAPAFAQYRLFPGDALEMSAAGLPELRHRTQINLDGEASFPLIGEVPLAGMTLSEARAKLQALLPTKELRRRTEDGREFPVIITPAEISLSIAEYRPVYLNGDVAKPGEQTFRPGITVRQAVALAGGYDVVRFRMNNPHLEQADLTSEYQSLWAEFAKTQAHVARLRGELGNQNGFDKQTLSKTPLPANLAKEITSVESDRFDARLADVAKEKAYLKTAIQQEEQRIATLSEQRRKESEGTKFDAEDLQRLQELYQKGSIPITRISEARRSLLLASTRELQTAAQLANVERERGDLGRKLQRIDDQRRLEVLGELQDANVRLATLRSRLEGVGEKLAYTGLVRSQLVRGKSSQPDLVVFRTTAKGRERLPSVTEETELQPGDVVEVSLQGSLQPAVPAQ